VRQRLFLLGADGHPQVAGRAGDDDARAARSDNAAELLQHQCHAEQIDPQDRLGGRLHRREPCRVDDLRDASQRLCRLGESGHRFG
jgi:hypothetical protein